MSAPSPLRKIIPPLVWPAGLLLLVGYCWVGGRSGGPDVIPHEAMSGSATVVVDGPRNSSVMVEELAPVAFAAPIPLLLGLALVIGLVIWGVALRSAKSPGATTDGEDRRTP